MRQVVARYSLFGRAGRKEFLLTHLYTIISAAVVAICMAGLLPGSLGSQAGLIWRDVFWFPLHYFMLFKDADQEQFTLLFIIGTIWLVYAATILTVAIRRLHDFGRTGFWLLILVFAYFFKRLPDQVLFQIPFSHRTIAYIVGSLLTGYQLGLFAYIVVLGFFPGQRGDNKHGSEPAKLAA